MNKIKRIYYTFYQIPHTTLPQKSFVEDRIFEIHFCFHNLLNLAYMDMGPLTLHSFELGQQPRANPTSIVLKEADIQLTGTQNTPKSPDQGTSMLDAVALIQKMKLPASQMSGTRSCFLKSESEFQKQCRLRAENIY